MVRLNVNSLYRVYCQDSGGTSRDITQYVRSVDIDDDIAQINLSSIGDGGVRMGQGRENTGLTLTLTPELAANGPVAIFWDDRRNDRQFTMLARIDPAAQGAAANNGRQARAIMQIFGSRLTEDEQGEGRLQVTMLGSAGSGWMKTTVTDVTAVTS